MKHHIRRLAGTFRKDEAGAVTVDWVVLTSAILGFGMVIGYMVATAAIDNGDALGARLDEQEIPDYQ